MGDKNKECCGGCPVTMLIAAIKRFAVKHIPVFRKRAERAAVGELLGKLHEVAEAPAKKKLVTELPKSRSTKPRNS